MLKNLNSYKHIYNQSIKKFNYLIPKVFLNPIWVSGVLVTLDEISIFYYFFFKSLENGKLIFTKGGLVV